MLKELFIVTMTISSLCWPHPDLLCQNMIEIQQTLLVSDHEININIEDVIFLRKNVCQKQELEGRQLTEFNQKTFQEFERMFARHKQDIQGCDVNKLQPWQVFCHFIQTNFASNLLPLILAVIIFTVRTKGDSLVIRALSVLMLCGSAILLIQESSCSEDHLKIWSLYSDSVRLISSVQDEQLAHSLQPSSNELTYNKEEVLWGNWIWTYLHLFIKECFSKMYVKVT